MFNRICGASAKKTFRRPPKDKNAARGTETLRSASAPSKDMNAIYSLHAHHGPIHGGPSVEMIKPDFPHAIIRLISGPQLGYLPKIFDQY